MAVYDFIIHIKINFKVFCRVTPKVLLTSPQIYNLLLNTIPFCTFVFRMQIYVVLFGTEINRDPNAATLICGIPIIFKDKQI